MRAVCCVLAAFCVAVCEGGGNVSDQAGLFLQVYGEIFTLRDGSVLADTDTRALDTMKTSVQRLLGVPPGVRVLDAARVLPEDELLRVLFLAVAGNFTVADRGGSGLPQRCALVVDAAAVVRGPRPRRALRHGGRRRRGPAARISRRPER